MRSGLPSCESLQSRSRRDTGQFGGDEIRQRHDAVNAAQAIRNAAIAVENRHVDDALKVGHALDARQAGANDVPVVVGNLLIAGLQPDSTELRKGHVPDVPSDGLRNSRGHVGPFTGMRVASDLCGGIGPDGDERNFHQSPRRDDSERSVGRRGERAGADGLRSAGRDLHGFDDAVADAHGPDVAFVDQRAGVLARLRRTECQVANERIAFTPKARAAPGGRQDTAVVIQEQRNSLGRVAAVAEQTFQDDFAGAVIVDFDVGLRGDNGRAGSPDSGADRQRDFPGLRPTRCSTNCGTQKRSPYLECAGTMRTVRPVGVPDRFFHHPALGEMSRDCSHSPNRPRGQAR